MRCVEGMEGGRRRYHNVSSFPHRLIFPGGNDSLGWRLAVVRRMGIGKAKTKHLLPTFCAQWF